MSLNGALQVGRSALLASQAAMQVAGNNMANAATKGYHRRSVHLTPLSGQPIGRGQRVGQGVQLEAIRREIDTALQARLRDALGNEQGAIIDQRFLSAIETLQNELTDNDLSSELSVFFNNFSELANNPEDHAMRSLVIQQGSNLASRIAGLRRDYGVVRDEVDRSLGTSVAKINDILDEIALVNGQIAMSEAGAGQANSLRDRRDILIDDLAQFFDLSVIEQANGSVDILVGSIPIVLGGQSRGVELKTESVMGQIEVSIHVAADGTNLTVSSGTLGALIKQREQTVQPAIDNLDQFAAGLIFEVNRLHSQGQGRTNFESVGGTYGVNDTTVALNTSGAGLPFDIDNGSFFLHVTHQDTGIRTTHQININGDTDSLDDLINEINVVVGVPNVTAAVAIDGSLTLTAASGYEMSFSDDSSGALAALGINTFFTGDNAADIDVNQTIVNDPNFLAAGAGHVPGSNGTAVAIADLQDVKLAALNNQSLRELWQSSVNTLAIQTDSANDSVLSTALVRESLAAQVLAVSGVSLDEEAINLMTFQRHFQAAARFIRVIDEMLETLLALG